MKISLSFLLFRRYFLSSKGSALIRVVSWICLAGIVISVSSLILIISVMGGFGQAIKKRLLAKEAHLLLHFEENPFPPPLSKASPAGGGTNHSSLTGKTPAPASASTSPLGNTNHSSLTDKPLAPASASTSALGNTNRGALKGKPPVQSLFLDKSAVEWPSAFFGLTQKQREGIKEILIFEAQDLILKIPGGGFQGVLAKGYSQSQWSKKAQRAERALLPHFSPQAPFARPVKKPVLLSYELSLQTGISLGDELILVPVAGLLLPPHLPPPIKTMRVSGVLNTDLGAKEGQIPFLYYPQGTIDFGAFSQIRYAAEITLYNPDSAPLYQKLFSQYKSQTWMERNSILFFALKLEKAVMALFLALALLISCLGIASALFLLISQKARDLALLQAVGLSPRQTVKAFTGVGLYLSLIGIAGGAAFGFLGTIFLKYNKAINFLPEIYQDRTLPAVFSPWGHLMIIAGAFLLAWVSCYVPARQISRMGGSALLKTGGFG